MGNSHTIRLKTRPDTRPSVADGWAGAEMCVFTLFDSMVMDQRTDGQTDGRTDGQSLLQSCVSATKKNDRKKDEKKERKEVDKALNERGKEANFMKEIPEVNNFKTLVCTMQIV